MEWLEERKDLLLILKEIAEGKVTLDFRRISASGEALYYSNAGWWFSVFIDEGDWDYLDRFKRVGEESWTEVDEHEPLFWRPSLRQLQTQWDWTRVVEAWREWQKP